MAGPLILLAQTMQWVLILRVSSTKGGQHSDRTMGISARMPREFRNRRRVPVAERRQNTALDASPGVRSNPMGTESRRDRRT